jgi:hypothetical protein
VWAIDFDLAVLRLRACVIVDNRHVRLINDALMMMVAYVVVGVVGVQVAELFA